MAVELFTGDHCTAWAHLVQLLERGTIAMCLDTLRTGPECALEATDVNVKCGDVCSQNIDFCLQIKLQRRVPACIPEWPKQKPRLRLKFIKFREPLKLF